MRDLIVACGALLAAACGSQRYTVQGHLTDENGSPAATTRVEILRVDQKSAADDNYLLAMGYDTSSAVSAVYTATSDGNGAFSFSLKSADVNAADGNPANLSVLYIDPNDADGIRATATPFYQLSEQSPTWDAGNLTLWTGNSASQASGTIQFSWDAAPYRSSASSSTPYYYLNAYQASSPGLSWAQYSTSSSVSLPSVVFPDQVASPEFFVFGHSSPIGSTQIYQNRTGYGTVTTGWGAAGTHTVEYTGDVNGLVVYDGTIGGTLTAMTNAYDGKLESNYLFPTCPTKFYVSLGASQQQVGLVLLYDLGVNNMGNGVITVLHTVDANAQQSWVSDFPLEMVGVPQSWAYVPFEWTVGVPARWIQVSVAAASAVGPAPCFTFLGEVRVFD